MALTAKLCKSVRVAFSTQNTTNKSRPSIKSPYGNVDIPQDSVWKLIKPKLKTRSNEIVLFGDTNHQRLTGGDLIKQVEKLAAHFQHFGIVKGTSVGIQTNDSLESAITVLAIMAVGAVYIPFSSMFGAKPDQLEKLCKLTDCTYFICTIEFLSAVQHVSKTLAFEHIFLMNGNVPELQTISSLLQQLPVADFVHPNIDPEADALCVLFTSGTTSTPKAVVHTHFTMAAALAGMKSPGNSFFNPGEIVYSFCPIAYAPGITILIFNLWIGASSVIFNGFDQPEAFLEIADKYKVTSVLGIPYRFWLILNHLDKNPEKYDISSIQNIYICGQVCSDVIIRRVFNAFLTAKSIRSAYGQTELLGFATFDYDNVRDLKSIGRPSANTEIKIVDCISGLTLGPNMKGEVVMKIPSVTTGYLKRTDATKMIIRDGWLYSGDIGYFDDSGRFYIVDRLHNIILCMDMEFSPADIENVLLEHPAVLEAAAVGLPDEIRNHSPAACIILRPNYRPTPELEVELINLVADKLEYFKHLYGGVHFFDSFPKTPAGKLQRRFLVDEICVRKSRKA